MWLKNCQFNEMLKTKKSVTKIKKTNNKTKKKISSIFLALMFYFSRCGFWFHTHKRATAHPHTHTSINNKQCIDILCRVYSIWYIAVQLEQCRSDTHIANIFTAFSWIPCWISKSLNSPVVATRKNRRYSTDTNKHDC